MMNVHVGKELRAKLGIKRRSVLVHKGDKVKLRVGEKAGHIGLVMEADYKALKLYVEGVTNKNARGVEKLAGVSPSNCEIVEGNFTTKDRAAMIARSRKK